MTWKNYRGAQFAAQHPSASGLAPPPDKNITLPTTSMSRMRSYQHVDCNMKGVTDRLVGGIPRLARPPPLTEVRFPTLKEKIPNQKDDEKLQGTRLFMVLMPTCTKQKLSIALSSIYSASGTQYCNNNNNNN